MISRNWAPTCNAFAYTHPLGLSSLKCLVSTASFPQSKDVSIPVIVYYSPEVEVPSCSEITIARWPSGQGNGLVIRRWWVRFPPGLKNCFSLWNFYFGYLRHLFVIYDIYFGHLCDVVALLWDLISRQASRRLQSTPDSLLLNSPSALKRRNTGKPSLRAYGCVRGKPSLR